MYSRQCNQLVAIIPNSYPTEIKRYTKAMTNDYLESTKKQFEYYKLLGEKTFAQLSDEQLFWEYNEESNSIATIVKHLWGNMLSRWTDFLTTDGEKEWRKRDEEFDNDIVDRVELLAKWNEAWTCLFNAIISLTENDLTKEIFSSESRTYRNRSCKQTTCTLSIPYWTNCVYRENVMQ